MPALTDPAPSEPGRWEILLFDLDHTLFDFDASKRESFSRVIATCPGDHDLDALLATLAEVENPLWRGLESGTVRLEDLNLLRWSGLVDRAGLDADPDDLGRSYLHELGRTGSLYPGAREMLESLAATHRLGMITNGYSEVQRARMEVFDFGHLFDVVTISSEIGIAKPDPDFFAPTMADLGDPDPATVLVVGDSLSSDIAGAVNAGFDSCWYNPHGKPIPDGSAEPSHQVKTFAELHELVG